VDIFESCRGQLSSQKHYDFGLRALKSVLFSAGAILRDAKSKSVDVLSSADEERIISDSFKGSILPKLLKEDAAILLDLLSKTFIKPVVSSQQDADFNNSLVLSCETLNLFPSPPWIEKILQIKQLVRFEYFLQYYKTFF
jgi:dynein heavy chain 1